MEDSQRAPSDCRRCIASRLLSLPSNKRDVPVIVLNEDAKRLDTADAEVRIYEPRPKLNAPNSTFS